MGWMMHMVAREGETVCGGDVPGCQVIAVRALMSRCSAADGKIEKVWCKISFDVYLLKLSIHLRPCLCLSAVSPTYPPGPIYLPTYLHLCLCLSAVSPPRHLSVYLRRYLPAYLPICLSTPLSCLSAVSPPRHLSIYLRTYLLAYLSTYLPIYAPVRVLAVCHLPAIPGPCRARHQRYFYNHKVGKCQRFTYGGCKGNANRFRSLAECEAKCADSGTSGRPTPIKDHGDSDSDRGERLCAWM